MIIILIAVGSPQFIEDFLFYLLSGSYMRCIGDNRYLKISKSSVVRVVDQVTKAIVLRKKSFIKFPNTEAVLDQYKEDYDEYSKFPDVIGAIDGTHVRIKTPSGPDAIQYFNRHGWPTINVCVRIFPFWAFICPVTIHVWSFTLWLLLVIQQQVITLDLFPAFLCL